MEKKETKNQTSNKQKYGIIKKKKNDFITKERRKYKNLANKK